MLLRAGILILVSVLSACTPVKAPGQRVRESQGLSTFAKYLKLAERGDPDAQNLIGFMLYFGEGVRMDRAAAHHWFHLSADQGNASAQLNLALMHYIGGGVPRDIQEAEHYLRFARESKAKLADAASMLDVPDNLDELANRAVRLLQIQDSSGESAYLTFCGGCHGFNGIAAYVQAPSFALAERMEKSDAELFRTIITGHGVMPRWENKLPDDVLLDALRFVRTLPLQYRNGIAQVRRAPPSLYFLFGPMQPGGVYRSGY
jgi:mono/diheme cytochrome c family protein